MIEDAENEEPAHLGNSGQPEWMDLVRPVVTFDDIQKEISFDDGGLTMTGHKPLIHTQKISVHLG